MPEHHRTAWIGEGEQERRKHCHYIRHRASLFQAHPQNIQYLLDAKKKTDEMCRNEKSHMSRFLRVYRNNMPGLHLRILLAPHRPHQVRGIYVVGAPASACLKLLLFSFFLSALSMSVFGSLELNNFASSVRAVSNMQVHLQRGEDSGVRGNVALANAHVSPTSFSISSFLFLFFFRNSLTKKRGSDRRKIGKAEAKVERGDRSPIRDRLAWYNVDRNERVAARSLLI